MSKLRPSECGVAEAPDSPALPAGPLERPNSPTAITVWTYVLNHSAAFVFCLLIAHYLLVFEFANVRPYKMNLIFMLIAIPFGFDFYVCFRATMMVALLTGFVTAAIAIFAMAAVVWFLFGSPIIGGYAERRDMVESITAVMLAFATGNAFAASASRILPTAFESGKADSVAIVRTIVSRLRPSLGDSTVRGITLAKAIVEAVGGLILAIGAVWVTFKGMFVGQ
jgi:hypothetical protein